MTEVKFRAKKLNFLFLKSISEENAKIHGNRIHFREKAIFHLPFLNVAFEFHVVSQIPCGKVKM